MLASDVMVTDHSSIGFEFCALDRPLIVFDAPGLIEAARINPEKVALLRSAATVVSDRRGSAEAVREALAAPQLRSRRTPPRRRTKCSSDPGTATDTGAAPGLRADRAAVHPAVAVAMDVKRAHAPLEAAAARTAMSEPP